MKTKQKTFDLDLFPQQTAPRRPHGPAPDALPAGAPRQDPQVGGEHRARFRRLAAEARRGRPEGAQVEK